MTARRAAKGDYFNTLADFGGVVDQYCEGFELRQNRTFLFQNEYAVLDGKLRVLEEPTPAGHAMQGAYGPEENQGLCASISRFVDVAADVLKWEACMQSLLSRGPFSHEPIQHGRKIPRRFCRNGIRLRPTRIRWIGT